MPQDRTRWALVLLFAATLLIRVGFGAILPVLPVYASQHGLSPLFIAIMTNAYLASHALLQGPAGHLSDRWGRRPVLVAGAGLYALVAGLFLLSGGPWLFTGLRLLEGVAASAVTPVIRAAVVDLVAPEARGKAFGALSWVDHAGLLLGPLAGGWAQSVSGIRAPFLTGAVLALLATAALLFLPGRAKAGSAVVRPAAPVPGGDLGRFLRSAAFWAAALPGISWAYLSGLYSVIWSLFMQSAGASPWQISLSFGLYALPVLLFMIPFGALTDRVGRPRMLLAGGLMAAVVTLGYGFFSSPVPLLILCALDGTAASLFTPASQAFIADITPGNVRGRFLGLVGSMGTGATMVAVTVVGALYTKVPTWALFIAGTLMLGAGTLVTVWLMLRRSPGDMRRELEASFEAA